MIQLFCVYAICVLFALKIFMWVLFFVKNVHVQENLRSYKLEKSLAWLIVSLYQLLHLQVYCNGLKL